MSARHCVAAFAALLALAFACAARAQSTSPLPDDCKLIGVEEAGKLVNMAVVGPDEATERQGYCLFTSKQATKDGSVLYGFVRAAQVPDLQRYYQAIRYTCAGIVPGAPREGFCKTIERLSQASDIDAYYAARSDVPNAKPAPDLGPKAVASSNGVFIRQEDYVLEAIVLVNQEVDVQRSTALAKLLLERLQPQLH